MNRSAAILCRQCAIGLPRCELRIGQAETPLRGKSRQISGRLERNQLTRGRFRLRRGCVLSMNSDPVVRKGNMWDIGLNLRHVTLHTVVIWTFRLAFGGIQATTFGAVAVEALAAKKCLAEFRVRVRMHLVAGRAGQAVGILVTTTRVHLIHMPDDLHGAIVRFESVVDPDICQRHSWLEIGKRKSTAKHCRVAAQMALRTDGFMLSATQTTRMNDRIVSIPTRHAFGSGLLVFNMHLARPVAALTSDRRFVNRQPILGTVD